MLKKYRGMILSCAILGLTATCPVFAAGTTPKATPIDMSSSSAYQDIFGGSATQSQCTADCGNGTGWVCTGASTYCEDGVGCIAQGSGGEQAIGLCGNNAT